MHTRTAGTSTIRGRSRVGGREINNQGVLGIVTDTDFTTGNVNRLNYEPAPRISHKFPVTCFQCSSPRINDVSDTNPGFSDIEGWLLRTYFNAAFENEVQARVIVARPGKGDFNHDGHLKVVVYFDVDHLNQAFSFPGALDAVHSGSHSAEVVHKILPSIPETRAAEMAQIFDTDPEGRKPDVVVLMFREENIAEVVGDYFSFAVSPRPPAQVNDEIRRDYLLPTLLANGGGSLQGTSMLRVASTQSGPLFNIIRPRVDDYKIAVQRIDQELPINYDGAGSSVDLDGVGENFPPIVHWKIQNGKFDELEKYDCNPNNAPVCRRP